MREYVTDAIVLGRRPRGEHDWSVDLFTRDLGSLTTRVVSGARSRSKFSPHLAPPNLVLVRLVRTVRYTLTDIATHDRFEAVRSNPALFSGALELAALVRHIAPPLAPDHALWECLVHSLEWGEPAVRSVLTLLGHDPHGAPCVQCGGAPVRWVTLSDHTLLCGLCAAPFPISERVCIPR